MNAGVRVEPTPAACSRQQMRLLRCRLRREDEVSNCRLPCSLPREKLYEFVSRVARRRALAWLRETIRVCTRVFILVHTFNMQAFAHKESLFEPNERGVVHASTRHAHQPRTRAAASCSTTAWRGRCRQRGRGARALTLRAESRRRGSTNASCVTCRRRAPRRCEQAATRTEYNK